MRPPLRLPTPDAEPEPVRVPEERGQLVPPSRRPPTAVATAAPKPRGPSGPPIPQKVSRVARIARSMLGTGLLAGGVALTTLPAFGIGLGLAVALLGADVIMRAAVDRGLLAYWRSRRPGGHSVPGQSRVGNVRRSA